MNPTKSGSRSIWKSHLDFNLNIYIYIYIFILLLLLLFDVAFNSLCMVFFAPETSCSPRMKGLKNQVDVDDFKSEVDEQACL